jgi:prevent-host-death family protein
MKRSNPNHKGNVAEMAIAAAATKLGVGVSKPLVEHARYDLIFDVGSRLLRVQCKWARRNGAVIVLNLVGFRRTAAGHVSSRYRAHEVDAVAAYCEDLDTCYLLPIGLVEGMSTMHLRLTSPRNGQRAALNWAAEHELHGAVAQLEERCRGTAEVTGSSPVSSTPSPARGTAIGALELRNRLADHLQRAAAGERFLVTRRGRPYVRLIPATDPLPLAIPPRPGR